jgi:RNA polymerase sigma factor (sigma-70 family)
VEKNNTTLLFYVLNFFTSITENHMKAYRVKVSVRNNLLINAIEAAGYKSVAEFERSAGIAIGRANCLVAMRDSPIQQTGEFSKIAKLMMEVLGAAPSDLWTEEQLMLKLRTNVGWREVDMDIELFKALAKQQGELAAALPSQEDVLLKIETAHVVDELLNKRVTSREQTILREMMSGEGLTLKEIGEKMEVSAERVRQLQMKALGKLRHPNSVDVLKKAGLTPEGFQ